MRSTSTPSVLCVGSEAAGLGSDFFSEGCFCEAEASGAWLSAESAVAAPLSFSRPQAVRGTRVRAISKTQNIFSSTNTSNNGSCQPRQTESTDLNGDDGGAYRRTGENGRQNAEQGTENRKDCSADGHAAKALEHPHGGQRREDHQCGDQPGTHKVHRQHDDDRNDDGDQQVVKTRPRAGRPCEALVKGHGEDLIVKQNEYRHDQHRHSRAQPYLYGGQRQDGGGTEQRAAHIAGKIGRGGENVHQKIANGKRPTEIMAMAASPLIFVFCPVRRSDTALIIVMTITSGISLVICSAAAMLVYGKEAGSKMIDRKPRYSTKFN